MKRPNKECKKMGIDPKKTCVFTDVMCTPKFYTKRVLMLPCLNRTRGLTGGFWVSTRGRLTTIAELFRFQGISRKMIRYASIGISARQMGGILGNTMSLPVCGRVLRQLLFCAGLFSELPPDPWDNARPYLTDKYVGVWPGG